MRVRSHSGCLAAVCCGGAGEPLFLLGSMSKEIQSSILVWLELRLFTLCLLLHDSRALEVRIRQNKINVSPDLIRGVEFSIMPLFKLAVRSQMSHQQTPTMLPLAPLFVHKHQPCRISCPPVAYWAMVAPGPGFRLALLTILSVFGGEIVHLLCQVRQLDQTLLQVLLQPGHLGLQGEDSLTKNTHTQLFRCPLKDEDAIVVICVTLPEVDQEVKDVGLVAS